MTNKNNSIGTQKGSIQVKMNEYYTATVRNLSDLERMLADENESKSELEVLSSYNVSEEFEAAVNEMVAEYLTPTTTEAPILKYIQKLINLYTLESELSDKLYDLNREGFDIEDLEGMGSLYKGEKKILSLLKKLRRTEGAIETAKKKISEAQFEEYFGADACCDYADWK